MGKTSVFTIATATILTFSSLICGAQTDTTQTSCNLISFTPNQVGQIDVAIQVWDYFGSPIPNLAPQPEYAVYYIPEVQGGQPNQLGCIGSISYSVGNCLWYIDPPAEYLVQGHFNGAYNDQGQLIYAPCDTEIWDVVGGPGYASASPR